MDVSNTGISFTVNEHYAKSFELDKKFNFILLFNDEVIKILMSKTVYQIPFVGSSQDKGSAKVGLTFHPVEELSVLLKQILNESIGFESLRKEFEEFYEKTRTRIEEEYNPLFYFLFYFM